MNRVLKWFFGILLGLVVVAVLVGAGFLIFNRLQNSGWVIGDRNYRSQGYGQGMPWRNAPGRGMPLNPGPQYQMPMHPIWGAPLGRFNGLHPLAMLFACLIGIGFLVVVGLGVVYLIMPRKLAVTPVATVPAAAVAAAAEPTPTAGHACPHCGRPVQADWSHCPYCGSPLTGPAEGTPPQA